MRVLVTRPSCCFRTLKKKDEARIVVFGRGPLAGTEAVRVKTWPPYFKAARVRGVSMEPLTTTLGAARGTRRLRTPCITMAFFRLASARVMLASHRLGNSLSVHKRTEAHVSEDRCRRRRLVRSQPAWMVGLIAPCRSG